MDTRLSSDAKPPDTIASLPRKRSFLADFLDTIETVVFTAFCMLLVFAFMFRIVGVTGFSMEDTLYADDRLLIGSYALSEPERGELAIIESSGVNDVIVKRIIGVGGDIIDIDFDNCTVSVNGNVLDEPYLNTKNHESVWTNGGAFDEYPITVPENCFFVLGDNRIRSMDSRSYEIGFIRREEVVGKVICKIYPFELIN